ncbi:hypothetical protein [Chitinimonas koreensis]|uniref:hypothetical protein n=1 Tax=Chitinimonas koreensis TaxID=356302 RepID=UPI00146FAEC7|nr:hypothetical protein [Chitinimonas koreensis]QNM97118.1 hypothetical protein H9L41_01940 [Chitinimonas koreensis]
MGFSLSEHRISSLYSLIHPASINHTHQCTQVIGESPLNTKQQKETKKPRKYAALKGFSVIFDVS